MPEVLVGDKILHNERYGVLEINKEGIITSYNDKARVLLYNLYTHNSIESLSGLDINRFRDNVRTESSDKISPVMILSFLSGIYIVDSFYSHKTDSMIVRFSGNDDGIYPFLNVFKNSSSVFFELDKDLHFILASDSFLKLSSIEPADLYGMNLSLFTADKDFNKFRSSVTGTIYNYSNIIEIDEFQFSFDGILPGYKVEVYPVFSSADKLEGYFCLVPEGALHRKCRELGLTISRMNEVVNFTSTVSHDCNNALTAVLGNISLAKMEARGNGELEELLADAEKAALKIKNLTEKLSTFIRSMKSQNK